jgi:hypothetical protein
MAIYSVLAGIAVNDFASRAVRFAKNRQGLIHWVAPGLTTLTSRFQGRVLGNSLPSRVPWGHRSSEPLVIQPNYIVRSVSFSCRPRHYQRTNLLDPKVLARMTGRDLMIYSSVDTARVVRVRHECKQRCVRVPREQSNSR